MDIKIKDMTIEQVKTICLKARTKANGKVKEYCVEDCPLNNNDIVPLFQIKLRLCDLVAMLNKEVVVDDK